MNKNFQHLKETTKSFNIKKQEQKPSTFLRVETKTKTSKNKNKNKSLQLL
jgi:hypothetical protein